MKYSEEVRPGEKIRLDDYDTSRSCGLSKEDAREKADELGREMGELQELLFAAGDTALLIVLQGRDTSGKDGAIRFILNYTNVQSCRVAPFKVPTAEELSHDFLWRVHRQTPPKGGVTIFNRSHYEDVLVVRVAGLAPEKVWSKRYGQINAFEELLSASGTVVLKFFLNISKKEQEERLLDREKDPVKAWKLSVDDWKVRDQWDDYTRAYEDALTRCSTESAPWRIIAADRKWFRDLAIAECIVETLRPMKKAWMESLESLGREQKAELEAFRASRGA